MNLKIKNDGPYKVTVVANDDSWQMVGTAYDMQVEQDFETERFYSDYALQGFDWVTSRTLTLNMTMNPGITMIMRGEIVDKDPVSKLKEILS